MCSSLPYRSLPVAFLNKQYSGCCGWLFAKLGKKIEMCSQSIATAGFQQLLSVVIGEVNTAGSVSLVLKTSVGLSRRCGFGLPAGQVAT